jgi:hypothetical protein
MVADSILEYEDAPAKTYLKRTEGEELGHEDSDYNQLSAKIALQSPSTRKGYRDLKKHNVQQ